MAKLSRVAGTTSQTLYVFLQDSASTAGAGKTGLVFNTAGLTCYYTRPLAAAVAVSLATQTVTGAWATGGFVEVDATNCPGLYRFDPPNAAIAAGVDQVNFYFKGTGVAPRTLELELTAVNNQSATAFMTSVGSVTGAVGSVTGAVGSVTGNVGGNVVGSVASVAAAVTVGTINANVITATSIASAALNGKGDWLLASSAPANFGALGITAGGHVSNVDTLTTYTGNTVQTGDNFARLGAPAGASIAADLAEIEGETDALLAGVTVSAFAAGSITDAAFAVPAEAAGPPAGVLSRLMWAVGRLGLRRVKKTVTGAGAGTVVTYLANGTSVWTTETYTTTAAADTTDDLGAGT